MLGHDPERDPEKVSAHWTGLVELWPRAAERQEHLLRQILHIRRCRTETTQGPAHEVELPLEGVQTGLVGGRDGSRRRNKMKVIHDAFHL